MKTDWDYSKLAKAYLKRPNYSECAINEMLKMSQLESGKDVCDIGAGVGHLTIKLAEHELNVVAVEPNDEMRKLGIERTKNYKKIKWFEGSGENTGQRDMGFDLVTFGSSFNVTNRREALKETKRILRNHGWFAAMWNHRDLLDPIQKEIENAIKKRITNYAYGIRREDQTDFLMKSELFSRINKIEGYIKHLQKKSDIIEAWRSHATLYRQAGKNFDSIIKDIERILSQVNNDYIAVPYTTRVWLAQLA